MIAPTHDLKYGAYRIITAIGPYEIKMACSRATQRLALYVNGNDEKVKNIADAISRRKFAPQGKTAMKMQANIMEL